MRPSIFPWQLASENGLQFYLLLSYFLTHFAPVSCSRVLGLNYYTGAGSDLSPSLDDPSMVCDQPARLAQISAEIVTRFSFHKLTWSVTLALPRHPRHNSQVPRSSNTGWWEGVSSLSERPVPILLTHADRLLIVQIQPQKLISSGSLWESRKWQVSSLGRIRKEKFELARSDCSRVRT